MLKEKKISRKKQIEQKATELFKSRGYAATSMRDLAAEMGLEAGSLYSHIKSKEEILRNVCFEMANDLMSEFDKIEAEKSQYRQTKKIRGRPRKNPHHRHLGCCGVFKRMAPFERTVFERFLENA